jgi:hypothetical protein
MLVSVGGAVEAQSSGHRKTDKLIYQARLTTASIRDTLFQIQNTMEGYNAIIDGKAPDNRKAYKRLVKDIGKCETAAENVGRRADAMQKVADKFFGDWEASLAGFNSEEMRAKSAGRMNATKANYDKIFEAGRQARELFDPFIANMDDQIRFLGHDLNPSAIADLQDEAAQLNADAEELDKAISETIKVAARYANSLEPD